MTAYAAPLDDMRFAINDIAGLDEVSALPGYEEATPDLVDAVLEEAGRFGASVLAPLNHPGDQEGCTLENGVVRTPKGFPEAYRQFAENGWNGVFAPEIWGGQGLPLVVATAVSEIWHAANMSFALCPLLTQSAIELLLTHGSPELRATYLEKLVSGEWCGTMNMTEPQAGSDLARIRSKAERDGDRYRVRGQKIFISHGEHDMADNIVHMVLARSPDGPEGIKGLSLFVVPKFLPTADGGLGERNDVRCVSLEHKMGMHAGPTCVMSYGDGEGAIGYLVGEENRGIEYMFTMMNFARLAVGMEAIGVAERAYQQARDYARERVQSRAVGSDAAEPVSVIHHPDVRRMLLSMRSRTEALRALAYWVAAKLDIAKHHPDAQTRAAAQALVDLMTPVVKAWSTEVGSEVADMGIQVHGGMGYIEETGAAQHLRDVRVTRIYEGTNAIQANDLVGRKVGREEGRTVRAYIEDLRATEAALARAGGKVATLAAPFEAAVDALGRATDWLVATYADDPAAVAAAALPYLQLLGTVSSAWVLNLGALKAAARLAAGNSGPHLDNKLISARFYATHHLPQAVALAETVVHGAEAVQAAQPDSF